MKITKAEQLLQYTCIMRGLDTMHNSIVMLQTVLQMMALLSAFAIEMQKQKKGKHG